MTTRAFLTTATLSVSSIFALAKSDESSMTVIANQNANVFKVVYKSASPSRVEVTIVNSRNEVVFTESFSKTNGFARPYNFNNLPEGEYTIEVRDNFGKKIEKVNYSLGTVKSLIKITKVTNDQAKFMLTVANKGTNIINVTILNADGEQLLDNSHVVDGDFGIVYNLLEEGSYTFIVSDKSGNSRTIQF